MIYVQASILVMKSYIRYLKLINLYFPFRKPPVSYTQKDVVFNFATLFSGFFNRYVDTVTLENDIALNIKVSHAN